jgi:hypothetical protein
MDNSFCDSDQIHVRLIDQTNLTIMVIKKNLVLESKTEALTNLH